MDNLTWAVVGFTVGGVFVVVVDWWLDQPRAPMKFFKKK